MGQGGSLLLIFRFPWKVYNLKFSHLKIEIVHLQYFQTKLLTSLKPRKPDRLAEKIPT